jgi:hypothetical protein
MVVVVIVSAVDPIIPHRSGAIIVFPRSALFSLIRTVGSIAVILIFITLVTIVPIVISPSTAHT